MHTDTLKELGFSPNEARIYEALLELGEASVSDIASHTNIHRRNAYDAIKRLVAKGFATPVIGEQEGHYVPVEPDKLLETLEEKKGKLQKILPDFQGLFEHKKTPESVYIYKGMEGFKNILRDILRLKQACYTIAAKGLWTNPRSNPLVESFVKESRKKKIEFCFLFDATVKNLIRPEWLKKDNVSYRVLPEKYSTPTAIDIYGDRVVIYVSENLEKPLEEITMFMMISEKLAQGYKQWFQFMWDHCKSK